MKPSRHRPPVEPLETRRLCAAIALRGHLLIVTGTARSANAITVGLSADGASVVATDTYQVGTGPILMPAVLTKTFPLSAGIRGLHVAGGNLADTITIDQQYGSFPIPATITGGAGNDTITGGDEMDRIFGNAGSDSLMGGAGNDQLFGGAGPDALIGGPGNDYLAGQGGHDLEEGDDGDDTIHDAAGPDTVFGGAGNNLFQIHSLKREAANDYVKGQDRLQLIAAPGRFTTSDDSGGFLGGLFPITSLL